MSEAVEEAMRKLAEGQRLQAEAIAEIARSIETTSKPPDWVSQRDSPLGSRAHRELARAGAFPSSRVGKLVLVRRADLDAYIAKNRIAKRDVKPENLSDDIDAQLEQIAGRAKQRKTA